jgi:hypothetical protein
MPGRDLREWIKYVEERTVREEPPQRQAANATSPAKDTRARSVPLGSPQRQIRRPPRRPESWDLSQGGKIIAPEEKDELSPLELEGATSVIPGDEGVGEPRPKPKDELPHKSPPRQPKPFKPVRSPRLKRTPALDLLMATFSPFVSSASIGEEASECGKLLTRLVNPELRPRETAMILGVGVHTIRRYAKSGLIPYRCGTGNRLRFHLQDVLAFARTYCKNGEGDAF